MAGALIFLCLVSCFCSCHPEDASSSPGFGGWWACIPGSPGIVATGETVLGRLPPPGHCAHSRLRHTPQSFCEEDLFARPGALAWRAGFNLTQIYWTTKLLSRILGCGAFPLPYSSLLASPRKELICLSRAPIFVTTTQATLPDHLASKAYVCSPTGLYIYILGEGNRHPDSESPESSKKDKPKETHTKPHYN